MTLPIYQYQKEILEAIENHSIILIQAEPGTGKTTQIPQMLLQKGYSSLAVLEPRRLAAKTAAERIAFERKEACGDKIGYHMRFESLQSPQTSVIFFTEGLFLKTLQEDPFLKNWEVILFDEFHERNIYSDFIFAYCLWLQEEKKASFKIILMSATCKNLFDHPILKKAFKLFCHGKMHPVEILYRPTSKPLYEIISLLEEENDGDTLIFFAHLKEILKTKEELESYFKNRFEIIPLSGSLSSSLQNLAFQETIKPKVILATNVAETSITLPHVTRVIDLGKEKRATFCDTFFRTRLQESFISQNSALQRLGRAGRTQKGKCIRLYSLQEYESFPKEAPLAILNEDLSFLILQTSCFLKIPLEKLPWLTPPSLQRLERTRDFLQKMNLYEKEKPSLEGREILSFPFDIRLAKFLFLAQKTTFFPLALALALAFSNPSSPSQKHDLYDKIQNHQKISWQTLLKKYSQKGGPFPPPLTHEKEIAFLLFQCYFDRVAKKLQGQKYQLCSGKTAFLWKDSSASEASWILALHLEERENGLFITQAIEIEEDFLLEDTGNLLKDEIVTQWIPEQESVKTIQRSKYKNIILEERIMPYPTLETQKILSLQLQKLWNRVFEDISWENEKNRLQEYQKYKKEIKIEKYLDFENFCYFICEGFSRFSQIKEKGFDSIFQDYLGYELYQDLEKICPQKLLLKNGKKISIDYSLSGSPCLMSFLQDFYGQKETPKIGSFQWTPLLKLLTPHQQILQTTSQLESFWKTTYKELKATYERKYPKHYWPEDPLQAKPFRLKRHFLEYCKSVENKTS